MKTIKKQTFYQLDPRFYKDYTGNGTGDLRGLAAKVDYFDFIGVDGIILQNLLALDEDQKIQEYTRIASELGTANELKTIISLLDAKGIDLYIEMPIGSIKESHRWFQKANDTQTVGFNKLVDFKPNVEDVNKTQKFKYSAEQKGYYEFDEKTKEIPLNWTDNKVIEQFAEVVRYWNTVGVKGFVFTGFEHVADPTKKEVMNEATLRELRKFYNTIKEVNDDIEVIGKSSVIFKDSYTEGASKVFDYFMTTQFSLLGTHKDAKTDLVGNFKPGKLAKLISSYSTSPAHIVTFGSRSAGRINSRWGNSGQWSHESAKLISMLLLLQPGSSSIYYGDEIGALNIGLTRLDNFQDDELFIRKEALLKDGVKEAEIMDAQIMQNPINSRSLMAWDDSKNGGFSNNEKTVTPVSTTYREINVKNQFADESSPLLFTKELVRIISNSSYRNIITNGKFSISSLIPGVIKMTFKLDKREIRVYANLTDKVRPIKKAKVGKVVLSNKYHKVYNELPKSLDAFEGIIISKQTDEAFKETTQLKLHKEKEKQKEIKLVEKTKELELKEAQRAEAEKQKEAERIAKQKEAEALEKQKAKEQAKAEADAAKAEIAKAKEEAKLQAQAEKEKAKAEAQAEKERLAKEAEKTKQLEIKEAQRAEAEKAQEQARIEREAEKTRQLEIKEAEKAEAEKAKEEARAEREAEKTRMLEVKEAQRAEKQKAKEEARAEREAEKTRMLEIKLAEKAEKEKAKEEARAAKAEEKDTMALEREAAKKMREEAKKFEIMDEEIHESERTSLTEDQIAATTQIDADEIDDFEDFLKGTDNDKK